MTARRALLFAISAGVISAALLTAPRPSLAQCSYPFLGSGSSVYYSAGTVLYPTIVQSNNYWTAIAVRPDAGTDWDLGVYQTATTFPSCVTNILASSTLGGSAVDVVVGDFNHNPSGSYYVKPYLFGGTGNARIEWDSGVDQLGVNAPRIQRPTGPTDVIECWDVFLEAGRNYDFEVRILGDANMRFMLFKNPAAATYWAGKNSAYYNVNLPANSATIGGLVVDQSDWYGLVMVNEDGGVADYQVQIESCQSPPTPLASTVSVTALEPGRRYSFFQSERYFTAIGVRPNQTANYWAMWVGEVAADLAPQCYQTHRASSFGADAVAYVVGDFNPGANPDETTIYARAYAPWGTGSSTGTVEWDDGFDQIQVDQPPTVGVTSASDVLTCWDTLLEAGYRYRVHFTHTGLANLKLALFDNPGGVFWAPRSEAEVESGTTFYYDATHTAWHALVLANDNGAAGNYEIAVERCTTPIALAPHTPYLNFASTTNPRFALNVADPTWAAMGVRSDAPSQDWNLTLYGEQLGPTPHCFSDPRATSLMPSGVADVIAGRPNLGVGGPSFFADPSPALTTSSNGIFEWEQGTDVIPVGGPPLDHAIAFDDVVHAWDVQLQAGINYRIVFEREGNLGAKLLLFAPTDLLNQGAWKDRSQAEFELTGITTYTPAVSGTFGVVVVNDDGSLGNCRIGIYEQGGVGVDPTAPLTTRIEGIRPNPVAQGSRILFAVATPSDVAFDVVNAAGRRVSQLDAGSREAGHFGIEWSGSGTDGKRLAAGVYFLRMRVNGQVREDSRVVLLP